MMDVLRHASSLEIFQFVVALAGLFARSWWFWKAFGLLSHLYASNPDDPRRDVAHDALERHLFSLMAHGVVVVLGIISILLPPPTRGSVDPDMTPEMTQATLVRIGLVILTTILTAQAFLEQRRQEQQINRGKPKETKKVEVVTTVGGKEVGREEVVPTETKKVEVITTTGGKEIGRIEVPIVQGRPIVSEDSGE